MQLAVPCALALGLAPLAACRHFEAGTLAAVGGVRRLAEDEFERLDSPAFFGLESVARPKGAPFELEAGLYHHREDGELSATGRTEITGTELALGLRKPFRPEGRSLRPYVGGGVSVFYVDRDNERPPIVGEEGSDLDAGLYVRAGCDWILTDRLFLGADVRWIQESQLDYGAYDLDGPALTLRVGWSF